MSFDDATIRFYRENAAEYVKGPQRSFARLHTFLVALPRPAKILELGCGSGRQSAEMIAAASIVAKVIRDRAMADSRDLAFRSA